MLFTNMTQEPYDNDGYHFMTVNGVEAKSFRGGLEHAPVLVWGAGKSWNQSPQTSQILRGDGIH